MLKHLGFTAFAAALLIAPVVGQSALAHDMDALYEAAKREGVNWYLSRDEAMTLCAPGRWSVRNDVPPAEGFKLLSQYRLNDQFQRFMTEDTARIDALRLRFKGYTGEVKGPEIR